MSEKPTPINSNNDDVNKDSSKSELKLKVSEKGCVSVYGIRSRFPISFYKDEWNKIIKLVECGELQKFIENNDDVLPSKK